LQVKSTDNIRQVEVIDMQGRRMLNETNINDRTYTRDLERNSMYVVRVSTGQETIVKKVTTTN
jgi:hypothetical protein